MLPARIPPHSVETERVVLGTILNDWQAAALMLGELRDDEFFETRHRVVFAAMQALFGRGERIDTVTLSEELRRRGDLERAGDAYYLVELTTLSAFGADAAMRHAMILREKAQLRRVIHVGTEAVTAAYDPGADAFEVVERLQARMGEIAAGGFRETHIREGVREAREHLEEWLRGERPDRFPSGIYRLDKLTSGYPVGEVTLFAAQSGAGKTSFAIQAVKAAGLRAQKTGHRKMGACLLFEAEMTRSQIVERAAAAMACTNLETIASGQASEYAVEQYRSALDALESLEIHVDDEAAPSLSYIAGRCEQIKAQYGLSFVVVDYDEKVGAEGRSEELRVSAIAQGLKAIAKRLGVAMLTLSQYSRDGEKAHGIPSDAWLRYSGKKLHEAAQVIHWYWPGYWVDKGAPTDSFGVDTHGRPVYDERRHGRGWLIVTKNRFGKMGRVELEFEQTTTRFIDHQDPEEFQQARARVPFPAMAEDDRPF